MIVLYDNEFFEERTLPSQTLLRAHGVIIIDKKSNTFRVIKHRSEVIDSNEIFPFEEIASMIRSVMDWRANDSQK